MKTYCTDAKLTELTPDLYGAALYMAPYDHRGETTLNRPLKSLVQGAVDAMAEPVDRHIEILLPPPKHSNHWLNAEQIRQLAKRFGVKARAP